MIKKKQVVYWARIIPGVGIYEVYELKIRTVTDTWFVGIEKRDKQAFLLNLSEIRKTIFEERDKALQVVKEAEKYRRIDYGIEED